MSVSVLLLLSTAILHPHHANVHCRAATTARVQLHATEPAMVADERRRKGRNVAELAAQKLVDRGEAATVEEGIRLQAARARAAYEAKYTKEERAALSRKGTEVAAQKLVDSGDAATLQEGIRLQAARALAAYEAKYSKEERSALSRKAYEATAQKFVDSGEASTMEEAFTLIGRRGAKAAAQKLVDRGEAATLEEAYTLEGRRRQQLQLDKYGWETLQRMNSETGVKVAKMRGYRTKYPGVRWQKKQDRKTRKALDDGPVDPETTRGFWRVSFSYKGKFFNVGSGYANEEQAARAHDSFVRANGMSRRLHFPE